MNRRMVVHIISFVLLIEAVAMIPPFILSLCFKEFACTKGFGLTILLCVAAASLTLIYKPKRKSLYATEGYAITALSWIVISVFGAFPFLISGEITNFFDALFEMVSGFTTTGASILTDVEAMSRSLLYWRSFSHWLGGMGVLVFLLAIVSLSKGDGNMFYLMQAESPGYDVGKVTPKLRKTALSLYLIYIAMTIILIIILFLGGMPIFDSFCIAYGTAGTGGFAITANGCATYNTFCQVIITVFMLLFGVNFSLYFILITHWGLDDIFHDDELRAYVIMFIVGTLLITFNILPEMDNFWMALHHASFQISSLMTTTGYSTVDFNLWPQFAKAVLIMVMFTGACAGSTAGGIKISRVLIAFKAIGREISSIIHPKSVKKICINRRALDERVVNSVAIFICAYFIILCLSLLLISVDNQSFTTNFSAVLTCISNVGPGFDAVGPASNFSVYSNFSTFVLTINMLLGRLEIFPMLILFSPHIWRRNAGRKN